MHVTRVRNKRFFFSQLQHKKYFIFLWDCVSYDKYEVKQNKLKINSRQKLRIRNVSERQWQKKDEPRIQPNCRRTMEYVHMYRWIIKIISFIQTTTTTTTIAATTKTTSTFYVFDCMPCTAGQSSFAVVIVANVWCAFAFIVVRGVCVLESSRVSRHRSSALCFMCTAACMCIYSMRDRQPDRQSGLDLIRSNWLQFHINDSANDDENKRVNSCFHYFFSYLHVSTRRFNPVQFDLRIFNEHRRRMERSLNLVVEQRTLNSDLSLVMRRLVLECLKYSKMKWPNQKYPFGNRIDACRRCHQTVNEESLNK